MSSILADSDPQVFACPNCDQMIAISMTHCIHCNAPVDPQWAARASIEQATVARALKRVNILLNLGSVMVVLFFGSFFLPFIDSALRIVVLVWVIIFPLLILIWFSDYHWGLQDGIDKNHKKLMEARKRIKEASWIWGILALLNLAREIFHFLYPYY